MQEKQEKEQEKQEKEQEEHPGAGVICDRKQENRF